VGKNIVPSNTINIVVVGHVDSGKSTLVGIFLKETAYLDKK
jgi:translation elongation factor EF-1alpha